MDLLTAPDLQDGNLVFDIPGAMVAIGFMPAPVPDGEAERFAANNYMWPEAVEVTKQHTAHLMVAVLPREMAAIDAGKTYVKIISSCLEADVYKRQLQTVRAGSAAINIALPSPAATNSLSAPAAVSAPQAGLILPQ